MFSTWFIVTCSLTCAAGVLYTYLELSSCKFLLERDLDPFVHFLYPSLPPRWWEESFISSGVLLVFRFSWNLSLFMPNKWCVLFYWSLVCLDIPGEFFFSRLVAQVRQETVSEPALEEEDITAANAEENFVTARQSILASLNLSYAIVCGQNNLWVG